MKNVTFLLIALVATTFVFAQQSHPIRSLETQLSVNYGPDSVYVSSPQYTGMVEKETYYATATILLESAANLEEIIVGFGNQSQGTDLASATFSFTNRQEMRNGVEYARNGKEFRIFLGEFTSRPSGYVWVKLKRSNGTYTNAVEQSLN